MLSDLYIFIGLIFIYLNLSHILRKINAKFYKENEVVFGFTNDVSLFLRNDVCIFNCAHVQRGRDGVEILNREKKYCIHVQGDSRKSFLFYKKEKHKQRYLILKNQLKNKLTFY